MGLEAGGRGGGTEKKEEKEEKIPHMCESIGLGKEVCTILRWFTIQIFGLYVEKHDVSKYFKFQYNRINSLEVMAFFILKK